jgi:hypothetical protein
MEVLGLVLPKKSGSSCLHAAFNWLQNNAKPPTHRVSFILTDLPLLLAARTGLKCRLQRYSAKYEFTLASVFFLSHRRYTTTRLPFGLYRKLLQ